MLMNRNLTMFPLVQVHLFLILVIGIDLSNHLNFHWNLVVTGCVSSMELEVETKEVNLNYWEPDSKCGDSYK